ncbi:MAG TPA: two-component regulator propeller domain-containing protein, partial [Chthonomonadaceae bacterium]|nr:two-component regulator propeller domain-containing protein [Chthonomonadaceae bacterium]
MRLCLDAAACLVLVLPLAALAAPDPPATYVLSTYPQRMSDRYTTRDGLPGKRVTHVKMDGRAVVVETETGQATFLEGQWKPQEPNRQVSFALPPVEAGKLPAGVRVLDALRTREKGTWVVTDRGVFRSEGETFVPFPTPTAYKIHQLPVNVDAAFSCVAEDTSGHLWFGTNFGVYATDGANWWNPMDRRNGLPYEDVTCLAFGPNSELWV